MYEVKSKPITIIFTHPFKNEVEDKTKRFPKTNLWVQPSRVQWLAINLDQFAKSRTNAVFVIPPANAKWMKWAGSGLSQDVWTGCSKRFVTNWKVKVLLALQRLFHGDQSHFMEDNDSYGMEWLASLYKAVNLLLSQRLKSTNFNTI